MLRSNWPCNNVSPHRALTYCSRCSPAVATGNQRAGYSNNDFHSDVGFADSGRGSRWTLGGANDNFVKSSVSYKKWTAKESENLVGRITVFRADPPHKAKESRTLSSMMSYCGGDGDQLSQSISLRLGPHLDSAVVNQSVFRPPPLASPQYQSHRLSSRSPSLQIR
jgi:hypothetical protein